jgi:hypothetical protein
MAGCWAQLVAYRQFVVEVQEIAEEHAVCRMVKAC